MTALLFNITDMHGVILADHLWVDWTHQMERLNIVRGDVITFTAKPIRYRRGFNGWHKRRAAHVIYDWSLSYPVGIVRGDAS